MVDTNNACLDHVDEEVDEPQAMRHFQRQLPVGLVLSIPWPEWYGSGYHENHPILLIM